MIYENIVQGIFLERPNRFIAKVLVEGKEETVHVKNTGRCRELLVKGVTVYLEPSSNPERKTKYSLISVNKNGTIINMDSQVPNRVAADALAEGKIEGIDASAIRREVTYGASRFDLFFEDRGVPSFMEVKGVTLEEDGYCRFPDAPTQRGVKHIHELVSSLKEGYQAYILFLIQFQGAIQFSPNKVTDPEFAQALKDASQAGVQILAYDCFTEPNKIEINCPVSIIL